MSYRHYFYIVDKEEAEKVRDLSYEEFFNYSEKHYPEAAEKNVYSDGEVELYLHFPRTLGQEELYEFGTLYCNTDERIYSKGEPLFRNKETQEHFVEEDPYLMGKEGMIEAIECYKDKIIKYYTNLLKVCKGEEVDEFFRDTPEKHIRGKLLNWDFNGVVDTNLNHGFLTYSWEYEHAIFNLLHILKTTDWDKKALLFYGY